MDSDRRIVSSGTIWEEIVGFSRAVRVGQVVHVSGTTATDEAGEVVGAGDPAAQTDYIIRKIERALVDAGAALADVVRTRIYVVNADDWETIGRVHGRFFSAIRPANTLVEVSRLVGDEYLVEIEAEAIIPADAER
ncbi:MAG: RidA family protein [Thermomicrobiales bacterium]|nr:RidA family protein [Thermomicrobiales bacterium]